MTVQDSLKWLPVRALLTQQLSAWILWLSRLRSCAHGSSEFLSLRLYRVILFFEIYMEMMPRGSAEYSPCLVPCRGSNSEAFDRSIWACLVTPPLKPFFPAPHLPSLLHTDCVMEGAALSSLQFTFGIIIQLPWVIPSFCWNHWFMLIISKNCLSTSFMFLFFPL